MYTVSVSLLTCGIISFSITPFIDQNVILKLIVVICIFQTLYEFIYEHCWLLEQSEIYWEHIYDL